MSTKRRINNRVNVKLVSHRAIWCRFPCSIFLFAFKMHLGRNEKKKYSHSHRKVIWQNQFWYTPVHVRTSRKQFIFTLLKQIQLYKTLLFVNFSSFIRNKKGEKNFHRRKRHKQIEVSITNAINHFNCKLILFKAAICISLCMQTHINGMIGVPIAVCNACAKGNYSILHSNTNLVEMKKW